jgi:hypothetical protein
MTEEKQTELSVPQMLKLTGENTAQFMAQVAEHVDKLEQAIVQLQNRVEELEAINDNNTSS